MSKKILSVKPTKNPRKFIFETEMSADELKRYVHEWFNDRTCNICIDSIKPSGLWANKLFVNVSFDQRVVNVSFDQHELPRHVLAELQRLIDGFNKNFEAEAKKTAQEAADWVVECIGSINTTMCVKESTARYFALACNQGQWAYYDGARIETKDIKLIKNTITGKQLWPRETERIWHVKTKDETYDVPEKTARAYLKRIKLYDSIISITDPDGKVVWQKKQHCTIEVAHHTGAICVSHDTADTVIRQIKKYLRCVKERTPTAGCIHVRSTLDDHVLHFNDIKHVYDENGHDMLADGLAKAQKPKEAWHISVKTACNMTLIPDYVYDVSPAMAKVVIEDLESGALDAIYFVDNNHKHHTINTCSVISVYDADNNIHWSKKRDKKPDTSFSAPSLLSRIYE